MVTRRFFQLTCTLKLVAFAPLLSGCLQTQAVAWKRATPPDGYVEATSSEEGNLTVLRYKGSGATGLKIHTFQNPKGGNLAYWSSDLREKLVERGYQLEQSAPIQSNNDVNGTRLDFQYVPRTHPDEETAEASYYTAILFVTDDYRVVVQLAGPASQANEARATIPRILERLNVGGCHRLHSVCPDDGSAKPAAVPAK